MDRFAVLLDLWTNEVAYLENKRQVKKLCKVGPTYSCTVKSLFRLPFLCMMVPVYPPAYNIPAYIVIDKSSKEAFTRKNYRYDLEIITKPFSAL